ncbi:MAG: SusC/RagA family TonB-linked outer membrane protein [Bacteroidaceae bacterium]|nr:SusC/RagA family TonB-linked outer membrane protein [Bacteroidaceae bacterium]
MIKPVQSVQSLLLCAIMAAGAQVVTPLTANAETAALQQTDVVKGTVKDASGEPAIGANVLIVGTGQGAPVEMDGSFTLRKVPKGATLKISLIGYKSQTIKYEGQPLNIVLEEDNTALNEVVVTAMGITRKASSLTYATQQIRSDELMKVQDPNLVNSIEGKISGVTITPSAGGAGGASKITLRGNKSILGNNAPLIVVDGVPMTNNVRGQVSGGFSAEARTEGGDPLSQINPDDIESMNVLKGANAAALYGSAAANGVVMITTKKGKEGKLDVNVNSNVTFDSPFVTPNIQNVYGGSNGTSLGISSWGNKLSGQGGSYTLDVPNSQPIASGTHHIHLRNAAKDDVADFFRTGVTTNNSVSLSGGTEKIKTYFSFANSHANGLVESNTYNRNTIAFRQSYRFWDRVSFDVNANYVSTRTRNRVGSGTAGNPIYDLYTMPRDVDFDYYRSNYAGTGRWTTPTEQIYYESTDAGFAQRSGYPVLNGIMQNWALQTAGKNNPYWLLNQNSGISREDRFYGSVQGKIDLYDGLAFQARVSLDHTKFNSESKRYATTWDPATLNAYGRYWLTNGRTSEIYTDYLLTYNKQLSEDWSVSATAGYVGHTINGESVSTDATATFDMINAQGIRTQMPTVVNYFTPRAGGNGVTDKSPSVNWDQALLFTGQVGWRDLAYVDFSYRQDWYRAFRQDFGLGKPADNYGYFGFGGNAIISELLKLKSTYLKYRLSYSEVGNSIPNLFYAVGRYNPLLGTYETSNYNPFFPIPEKTKSFETGLEMQFLNNRLNADITYYNAAVTNSYLTVGATNGRMDVVNSGRIRNQGVELTVGYDWMIGAGWRWRTSANLSLNFNKIEETYRRGDGSSDVITMGIAKGIVLKYVKGGKYGDIYTTDYTRWRTDVYQDDAGNLNTNGTGKLVHKAGDVYVNAQGAPSFDGNFKDISATGKVITKSGGEKNNLYLGNMNSVAQLSWSNTISYKNFSLYFLINGRIGGKVLSLTESYLDQLGLSQRTADARLEAERLNLYTASGAHAMYINEGRDLVPVKEYYEGVGGNNAQNYVYNATNFRLRELSIGYTWRDLLGEGKHLSVSAIARNLFFLYKDAPVDPDVSLSTGNGLNGFEMFSMPSTRSFGVNVKLNF